VNSRKIEPSRVEGDGAIGIHVSISRLIDTIEEEAVGFLGAREWGR
jgi:hypothetical protein